MKHKKHKDERRNINNMRNKTTSPSIDYEQNISAAKDDQKSNYDNQTDNKHINKNIDMSIRIEEEKKKLKTKTMDKKEENPPSPPEAVTTPSSSPLPTSSASPTPQPEVFDSSSNNAMSEMKEAADMRPDETAKVFSYVEEKQQLDPITTSIYDNSKNSDPESRPSASPNPTTFPTMVDSALQERDPSARELIEEDILPTQDVKLDDITQVNKGFEKQDHLDESVTFYDNENKEYYSSSLNNDNNNPLIVGIKFWQAQSIAWINAYNEFLKAWIDNAKTDS